MAELLVPFRDELIRVKGHRKSRRKVSVRAPARASAKGPSMFKRILVPTDGSLLAEHSARAAIELARFLDATIIAVYAYPTFRVMVTEQFVFEPQSISPAVYAKAQQKIAKKYLGLIEKAATAAGVRCTSRAVENDNPAVAIVETASSPETPCDLIFIGAHGHGLFSQVFLGSVTTKVQAMCAIPVLVYREPNVKKAPVKARTKRKSHA